jgi:hypothetical protein
MKMEKIYRVDGINFNNRDQAIEHVAAAHFPDAKNLGCECEPDRDGFNLLVFDEDSDAEPVTIFIV